MSQHDISQMVDPLVYASIAAMRRAAELARKTAIQTDTGIVVAREGKVVYVSARELRQSQSQSASEDKTYTYD